MQLKWNNLPKLEDCELQRAKLLDKTRLEESTRTSTGNSALNYDMS